MLSALTCFITFKCNYQCPYCELRHKVHDFPQDRSAEEWIRALQRYEGQQLTIDFTGGEPLVFLGFEELIRFIPLKHRLAMTTNLSRLTDSFPMERFFHITASFHPTQGVSPADFIQSCKNLKGRVPGLSVNYVAYPPQVHLLPYLKVRCRELGLALHVDPQGGHRYTAEELELVRPWVGPDRFLPGKELEPRWCSAGSSYLQVYPDGSARPCFARGPVGNFIDREIPDGGPVRCELPSCGGCDYDAVWFYDDDGRQLKAGK